MSTHAEAPAGRPRHTATALALALAAALAATALPTGCGDASGPSDPDLAAAAATITPGEMHDWIAALSHDSMQGRWTPSPQMDQAAATAAAHFAALGLTPPFGGGFLQTYPVIEPEWTPPYPLAPNAAAIVPGSDPALRDEYVVLVAHLDHVGTRATGGWRCTPVGADSLCNGADDNASGSAAILEIAEALSQTSPAARRSIVLLLTSGEEHGMHGVLAFIANPPVPIDRIVAAVSLDMISRNAPDSIAGIGLPYTTLGGVMQELALARPELGLTVTGDLWPGSNLFYRSDHAPFADTGAPALFFFSGPTPDTHAATNEVEGVNPDKAARVARLAFYLAYEVASRPTEPYWLRPPGPPTTAEAR